MTRLDLTQFDGATEGPLTVAVDQDYPFRIRIRNAVGETVEARDMPCHSTNQKTANDAINWRRSGFSETDEQKAEYREVNRRAIANANLHAAAPTLRDELRRAYGEIDALRDALTDCRSGLVYIRETHGELYGVGWDRAIGSANSALGIDQDLGMSPGRVPRQEL